MPPVILVHGFAQSPATFDEVRTLLDQVGVKSYAFCLAGHGARREMDVASEAQVREHNLNKSPFLLGVQADRLLAFCRQVAALEGEPAVLVGYSMGGRVALEAAWRALNEEDSLALPPFSALVLESAGLGPNNEEERFALYKRAIAWCQRMNKEGLTAFMDWWETLPLFESQRALPQEKRGAQRAMRLNNSAEALMLSFKKAGAHEMRPASEALITLQELAQKGTPVRYLVGGLDEKYTQVAARVAREASAVEVSVVEGAGHNIHLEAPAAFVAQVIKA